MIIMPSNNSGIRVGYLAGKYPQRIGWLISPGGWRTPPSWMPTALDNGAFGAFTRGDDFDVVAWQEHIETAHQQCQPSWMVVPDVVADREKTLDSWHMWQPILAKQYPHTPLAIAVQDGMTPTDIPAEADIIFIGGTTEWKWRNLRSWTDNFKRVHVARVNTERMLWMAHDAGAESCDGTGWFRGDEQQLAGLHRYLEQSTTGERPQLQMNL